MPSPDGAAFRELLLDPSYWRPRLDRLEHVPRSMVVFPRPDLCRPGVEVVELRLRAHDGARLVGILGRPSFCARGEAVRVRVADALADTELDWHAIDQGQSDLVFTHPPDRYLADRVLDVVRMAQSVASIEGTGWEEVHLLPRRDPPRDEQILADLLRAKGWIGSDES